MAPWLLGLLKLSYMAPELHVSLATWPPETELQGSFETELQGSLETELHSS